MASRAISLGNSPIPVVSLFPWIGDPRRDGCRDDEYPDGDDHTARRIIGIRVPVERYGNRRTERRHSDRAEPFPHRRWCRHARILARRPREVFTLA